MVRYEINYRGEPYVLVEFVLNLLYLSRTGTGDG